MPSFRFTPIALALLLSGVLAYAAWNRPAPPPPREAPPVADAPPPPPRPTVWREVRDESLGVLLELPDDVTGVASGTPGSWLSDRMEIQVLALDPTITTREAALATVGGRSDVVSERTTRGGGLLLVKSRGVLWFLTPGGHGWWRAGCRITKGYSIGHSSMNIASDTRADAERACASLRPVR